jgi:hypothetical protein
MCSLLDYVICSLRRRAGLEAHSSSTVPPASPCSPRCGTGVLQHAATWFHLSSFAVRTLRKCGITHAVSHRPRAPSPERRNAVRRRVRQLRACINLHHSERRRSGLTTVAHGRDPRPTVTGTFECRPCRDCGRSVATPQWARSAKKRQSSFRSNAVTHTCVADRAESCSCRCLHHKKRISPPVRGISRRRNSVYVDGCGRVGRAAGAAPLTPVPTRADRAAFLHP